jgi:hypothetical protein
VVSARAETPISPAAADCLAKPNEPSAKGRHWFYRVDHSSGRHCWYQRPVDAATDAPKDAPNEAPRHARTAAATTAPSAPPPAAPAAPPVSDTPAPALTADNGASFVPPVDAPTAPIAAPTAAPYGSFGGGVLPVMPPPVVAPSIPVQPVDSAAQAPVEPQVAPPPPDEVAPKPAPPRSVSVARRDEYADPASHLPALFGAVSALVIIILGSFVGRFLSSRRERRADLAASKRDQLMRASSLPEAPGLVPVLVAADRVVRETPASLRPESPMSPDDWGMRRARRPRRAQTPAAPIREATRVLEDNVRELLGRLQNELRGASGQPQRRAATTPADTHAPTERELDAVLAMWRARRGNA